MGPSDTDDSSPGSHVFPYQSAEAFRTALRDRFAKIAKRDRFAKIAKRDRFAKIAKTETGYSLDELQPQFAYDRALARLFTAPDAASGVLKGAGALLARLEQARHSKDTDVHFAEQPAAASDATSALRRAPERDLGDFFGFEITRIVPLQEEAKGSRVHVRATLGAKTFAVFHIDVVVGTAMSGEPDEVAPLTPLHIDGLVRPPYRAFPLPDHLADKFCTIFGTHSRGETVTGRRRSCLRQRRRSDRDSHPDCGVERTKQRPQPGQHGRASTAGGALAGEQAQTQRQCRGGRPSRYSPASVDMAGRVQQRPDADTPRPPTRRGRLPQPG